MNDVKLYPVIELMDIYYGYRYGWLTKLLEVSDTVMLRPETKLGKAFNRGVSIKQYLAEKYGVPMEALDGLKIMLDHGIFVNNEDFAKIFSVQKSPKTLTEIYDVLGVNYGLAYDVPSRLHIEIAIEITLSKLLNRPPNYRMLRALYPSMRTYVENLANVLLTHVKIDNSLFKTSRSISNLKRKMYKLMNKNIEENISTELHDALYALSERTVKETVKNLEEQLEFKLRNSKNSFTLVPVVQGLFEEHARECLNNIINLLISYQELSLENNKKYIYIAIGTGGRVLSSREAEMINRLMQVGIDRARKSNVNVRFHVLGWSSPKIAEKLKIELIYSSDSLSARRRAVEGKVYILTKDGEIRPVHVTSVDPNLWNCSCPVCSDPKLRSFVLDPSGSRKNDARIVHNLWVIKQYISSLKGGGSL